MVLNEIKEMFPQYSKISKLAKNNGFNEFKHNMAVFFCNVTAKQIMNFSPQFCNGIL